MTSVPTDSPDIPLIEDEDGAPYPGGVQAIAAERARQIEKGYTPEHDALHQPRDLIDAAMGYLVTAGEEDVNPYIHYPWMDFKRGTPTEHLARAGALIAAALDLMDAAETVEEVPHRCRYGDTNGDGDCPHGFTSFVVDKENGDR